MLLLTTAPYSDVKGGEIIQYPVSSDKTSNNIRFYECIGEPLGVFLSNDDSWEDLADEMEDAGEVTFRECLKLFHACSKWIPTNAVDKLMRMLVLPEEEELKKSLETYIKELNAC